MREGDNDDADDDADDEDLDDKCVLTGPRSLRTQGYHRRLMEREPLCIPCGDCAPSGQQRSPMSLKQTKTRFQTICLMSLESLYTSTSIQSSLTRNLYCHDML